MTNRRLAYLAGLCGVLLVSGTAANAAAFNPSTGITATAARAGSSTAPVRIVTYNIQAAKSPAKAVRDLKRLADANADILALQEMGSPRRRAAVTEQFVDCSTCEYDAFMPDTPQQSATPILFKWDKFRLVSTGTKQVSDATFVGRSGAGPATLKAKFVNYVELWHRPTGQVVYVMNNHAVPSIQGRDGGRNHRHPERLELFRQHMEGLKEMATEFHATGAAVFTAGDFNVNYRRDSVVRDKLFPYHNLGQVGLEASYKHLGMPARGTHWRGRGKDVRLIDYVLSIRHRAVTPKAQQVLRGYSSDHRPVMVEYAIKK